MPEKLEIFSLRQESVHISELLCTCKFKDMVITLKNESLYQIT